MKPGSFFGLALGIAAIITIVMSVLNAFGVGIVQTWLSGLPPTSIWELTQVAPVLVWLYGQVWYVFMTLLFVADFVWNLIWMLFVAGIVHVVT